MKTFKFLFVALALVFSSTVFAASEVPFEEERSDSPISYEIEKMLADSNLIIEKDFVVTVIFKVNAEKRIELRSIESPDEEVNRFLEKRLKNRKLHGEDWFADKLYELPVKVQARR